MLLLAGLIGAIGAVRSTAGGAQTYLVVYKGSNVKADAAARIEKAGGTLVYSYTRSVSRWRRRRAIRSGAIC